jgi:dihydrofolate synthase/folylpolyglutamate synthase
MDAPHTLLQRLAKRQRQAIDLSLRDSYFRLLENLGNPQLFIPPVIHVAGTNGKGSTLAFLRSILEGAGKQVHAYTSPHLVRFNERIRLGGVLIADDLLVQLLQQCEKACESEDVTYFEVTTALAFLAFARIPADFLLLETGMGGRLDATNILRAPLATIITRISYDHVAYLGDTLEKIAREKAGIFRQGVPAVIAPQKDAGTSAVLKEEAARKGAVPFMHGEAWHYTRQPDGGLAVRLGDRTMTAPRPSLLGDHQYDNAATALAALMAAGVDYNAAGIGAAEWPARLQRLTKGPLVERLPPGAELWLDGGHNDSAGAALALQAQQWAADGKPLKIIYGMIEGKEPEAFLAPLAAYITGLASIRVPTEMPSMPADATAEAARKLGIASVQAAADAAEALSFLMKNDPVPPRILITGSLYLAGHILKNHG